MSSTDVASQVVLACHLLLVQETGLGQRGRAEWSTAAPTQLCSICLLPASHDVTRVVKHLKMNGSHRSPHETRGTACWRERDRATAC